MPCLIRYGEIALKGKNRADFERQLQRNIKDCVKRNGHDGAIKRLYGRMVYEGDFFPQLAQVFGIISISPAVEATYDLDSIKAIAADMSKDFTGTFRVSVKRSDKKFPVGSMDLEMQLGGMIQERTGAPVKLKGFEHELGIVLIQGQAFIFTQTIHGLGGLPVGTQGTAYALINDDHDRLAALMVMRRGCIVHCIGSVDSVLKRFEYGYRIQAVESCPAGAALVRGRQDLPIQRDHPDNLELDPLVGLRQKEIEEQRVAYDI